MFKNDTMEQYVADSMAAQQEKAEQAEQAAAQPEFAEFEDHFSYFKPPAPRVEATVIVFPSPSLV